LCEIIRVSDKNGNRERERDRQKDGWIKRVREKAKYPRVYDEVFDLDVKFLSTNKNKP